MISQISKGNVEALSANPAFASAPAIMISPTPCL